MQFFTRISLRVQIIFVSDTICVLNFFVEMKQGSQQPGKSCKLGICQTWKKSEISVKHPENLQTGFSHTF